MVLFLEYVAHSLHKRARADPAKSRSSTTTG